MVDGNDRAPDRRAMAVLADIGRRRMAGILASRVCAVMTADTIVRDRAVIEIGRDPGDGRMAVVAIIAARDVRRVFARCNRAVMAGRAGTDYLRMVNGIHGRPDHVVMAVFAYIRRIDMS